MSQQNSNNHPFHGCTLRASLRSPFARRVRVAFIEHGLSYHEVMDDVFQPSPELLRANPLARVPVASLRSGTQICESQQILNAAFGERPSPEEAAISGLAMGLCDKIVERLLESLRPSNHQDAEIFADFERLLPPTLSRLEDWAKTIKVESPAPLRQCQIDAGVALAYLCLRVSKQGLKGYPACAALLATLESRESFKKTTPPPA